MLDKLKTKTMIALCFFLGAKIAGLMALVGMAVTKEYPAVPIVAGSLWGLCLLGAIFFSISSWRDSRESREQEEYLRLKKKYDTALVVHR